MDFSGQISQAATTAIANKTFPGCVVGIVGKQGERQILPFGNYTYEKSSPTVDENTMYDTASLTKSIPTGSLALQLIDEGKLRLDDRLIDYIPEFSNSDRAHVLIKHLLTYTLDGYGFTSTAGKVSGKPLRDITAADLQRLVLTHDFEMRPGTVFKYTNIPATLLGLVVEKITGDTLDTLADERFFRPLHMVRSTFHPERFPLDSIAPTERDDWRGLVHGIVHDESAYIYKKEGTIVGHAGLFSTVPDILHFLEMLLHRGTFRGKKYFSDNMVEYMGTNQISALGKCTGLGWELHQPRYMGEYCTTHTFGKTGFTGTLCVCDVEKGIAYVILSNRIHPKRPTDSAAIDTFRKGIGDIVLK